MRLVDAEEAREDMLYTMCGTGWQSEAMWVIDRAPTIEAIPVEFIWNRIEQLRRSTGANDCRLRELERLLRDWNAEQEGEVETID